jgi:hypothetical protein
VIVFFWHQAWPIVSWFEFGQVESLSELRGFLDRFYAEAAGKAQQWGLLETNWRSVLIEEYIGGSEVDIDCAVERYICVSCQ